MPEGMMVPEGVETADVYHCSDCRLIVQPGDEVVVYECSRCGATTDSEELGGERARCQDCNIFMGKATQWGCPECKQPQELDDVAAVVDHDGELVLLEDFHADGPSRTERYLEERAAAKAAVEAKRHAARQAALSVTHDTTYAEVVPGDRVYDPSFSLTETTTVP